MATRAEIKLVKFSGKNADFNSWYSQFRRMARLQEWKPENYPICLMLHLEGPALEYAESLGDDITGNLLGLHRAMSDRFGIGEKKQRALDDLLHFHRKSQESLTDYEIRLRGLLMYGYPNTDGEEREKMGVNLFITGLEQVPHASIDQCGKREAGCH
ncbi:hypothetical protein Bbelb_020170 [Branchiostoma belcheri]|nr:hypothetical protein Bbelb_020170 [Branchiostoma belcheri]